MSVRAMRCVDHSVDLVRGEPRKVSCGDLEMTVVDHVCPVGRHYEFVEELSGWEPSHREFYPTPGDGASYGLEHPFVFVQWGERFVVYRRSDGLVFASYYGTETHPGSNVSAVERARRAEQSARDECLRMNGIDLHDPGLYANDDVE